MMSVTILQSLLSLAALQSVVAAGPTLTIVNSTVSEVSNGNGFSIRINSAGYSYSMMNDGKELVKGAAGGYTDTGGKTTFHFPSAPKMVAQTNHSIHVQYQSNLGDVFYVLFDDTPGFYHYMVNKNPKSQGEVRSLYRFDPGQFTHGRTQVKNAPLPDIADINSGYKVQDETWQRPNGSYITKYDFSSFVRDQDFHGVYGEGVGAWLIAPGIDYYIGDHLKQELMLHRESKTNDAVLLHMYHGSHYNSEFSNNIPVGKTYGPWLLYLNDGNIDDAAKRATLERQNWPYTWFNDTNYQNRGNVSGTLKLDDGRPASGAAVFLGDPQGGNTNNQGTTYQYTTYADENGVFSFENVRREQKYTLKAWANGGSIADIQTVHVQPNITIQAQTNLGSLTWKTSGFKLGGAPMEHGLTDRTPANLVYAIGTHNASDWWFAQSAQGNWTVLFNADLVPNRRGVLSLSFAGYTSQNGYGLGHDSQTLPEQVPVGLNVSMNENFVGEVVSETATDGAIYRSATTAGGYYYSELTVPAAFFINGSNRMDLSLTQNHRWRGIMWDALKFEWL